LSTNELKESFSDIDQCLDELSDRLDEAMATGSSVTVSPHQAKALIFAQGTLIRDLDRVNAEMYRACRAAHALLDSKSRHADRIEELLRNAMLAAEQNQDGCAKARLFSAKVGLV
jgi:hypothetical protein